MKLLHSRIFLSNILLTTAFLVGCNSKNIALKTTVSVVSLKRAILDTGKSLTLLQVIIVYPAQTECAPNKRYANLYICRKFSNGDTVYVFEECKKVESFALDTSSRYAAVINKNNMTAQWPSEFTVFIPTNFRIPDNAKCFFANLDYQTEY